MGAGESSCDEHCCRPQPVGELKGVSISMGESFALASSRARGTVKTRPFSVRTRLDNPAFFSPFDHLFAPDSSLTMPSPIPLTWNEALSGIFGSISLASWIFLTVPQLTENYTQGHADGISLTFLFIWFVGDVTNLVGAIWAGLVPTVIALGAFFCFSDGVLIGQCLYYKALKGKSGKGGVADGRSQDQSEETPLLNENGDARPKAVTRRLTDVTEENLGLPGSRRKSSAASGRRRSDGGRSSLDRVLEEPTRTSTVIKNIVSVLLIIIVGTAGWAIAWKTGAWRPTPVGQEGEDGRGPVGAEVLGYISAVAYLGARIPQIIKNQRERSCEGLSLLFFLLSLMGNATYGAAVSWAARHHSWASLTSTPDPLPLRREAIFPHQSPLAHRFAWDHGRGCHHLRAIPHVRREARQ